MILRYLISTVTVLWFFVFSHSWPRVLHSIIPHGLLFFSHSEKCQIWCSDMFNCSMKQVPEVVAAMPKQKEDQVPAVVRALVRSLKFASDWWGWFEYNWICHNMSHSESFCELCVIKRSLLSTKGHCEPIAQHVSKQNAPRIQDKVSSWF